MLLEDFGNNKDIFKAKTCIFHNSTMGIVVKTCSATLQVGQVFL